MSDTLPPLLAERCTALRAARDAQLPPQILSRIPSSESTPRPSDPSSLYQTPDLLTPRQLEIVQTDATGLAKAIASKQYTSVEIIEAFIITACCAHQGTNCLAWPFAEEALERAKWLDAELERTGKVVGPMHGVPMSVKGEWSVLARCFADVGGSDADRQTLLPLRESRRALDISPAQAMSRKRTRR